MNEILHRNLQSLAQMLKTLESLSPQVEEAAKLTLEALTQGRKLLACGNGGSSADAMHFATEFVCRFTTDRRPYPAICLGASGGDLTAIGNDYGYEEVFARQVGAFGQPGDVLFVFTTSGQSENVRRALLVGQKRHLKTVAFLGRDGGNCRGLADVELLVEGTETARIQEAHKVLLHTLCEIVEVDLPRK